MTRSAHRIFVTGGAGFIGSAVCRLLIDAYDALVINVDKLTYAANLRSLDSIADNPRYVFERADICNRQALDALFAHYQPTGVIHLAAESHVDRSISDAGEFLKTNVEGTFHLLEAARRFYGGLDSERRSQFRFVHVSTDEVYGSLGAEGLFHEDFALSTELAIFRQQSGFRSFGTCLAHDLRIAGSCIELLKQLWASSISRKANSVDGAQCVRG